MVSKLVMFDPTGGDDGPMLNKHLADRRDILLLGPVMIGEPLHTDGRAGSLVTLGRASWANREKVSRKPPSYGMTIRAMEPDIQHVLTIGQDGLSGGDWNGFRAGHFRADSMHEGSLQSGIRILRCHNVLLEHVYVADAEFGFYWNGPSVNQAQYVHLDHCGVIEVNMGIYCPRNMPDAEIEGFHGYGRPREENQLPDFSYGMFIGSNSWTITDGCVQFFQHPISITGDHNIVRGIRLEERSTLVNPVPYGVKVNGNNNQVDGIDGANHIDMLVYVEKGDKNRISKPVFHIDRPYVMDKGTRTVFEGLLPHEIVGGGRLDPPPATPPPTPVKKYAETIGYDAAAITGVKDGLSGMWVSPETGYHWFVVDHVSKHPLDHRIFCIDPRGDAGKAGLRWSGRLIDAQWRDVEDLTGCLVRGLWHLAMWDAQSHLVYTIRESWLLNSGELVRSRLLDSGELVSELVIWERGHETTSIPFGSYSEAMFWDRDLDSMMWVAPRGGATSNNDLSRSILAVDGWTSQIGKAAVEVKRVGSVICRPKGSNVPNTAGAADLAILPDGTKLLLVAGVGGTATTGNMNLMIWDVTGGYGELGHPDAVLPETRPSENVAANPDGKFVYVAGEGGPGPWGAVLGAELKWPLG